MYIGERCIPINNNILNLYKLNRTLPLHLMLLLHFYLLRALALNYMGVLDVQLVHEYSLLLLIIKLYAVVDRLERSLYAEDSIFYSRDVDEATFT